MTQTPQTPAPTAVRKPNDYEMLRAFLRERKTQVMELAPRAHEVGWDYTKNVGLVVHAASKNDKLLACTKESIYKCFKDLASLALEPNSPMQEAALVPYRQKNGTYLCQLQIMYQGMIALAYRTGALDDIAAHIVYENDTFTIDHGKADEIHHTPARRGPRGEAESVWGKIVIKGASKWHYDYMRKEDILIIKNRVINKSQFEYKGPWITDEMEMWRKTMIKRLFKYMPKTMEMVKALEVENETEGVEEAEGHTTITVPEQSQEAKSAATMAETAKDAVKRKSKSKAEGAKEVQVTVQAPAAEVNSAQSPPQQNSPAAAGVATSQNSTPWAERPDPKFLAWAKKVTPLAKDSKEIIKSENGKDYSGTEEFQDIIKKWQTPKIAKAFQMASGGEPPKGMTTGLMAQAICQYADERSFCCTSCGSIYPDYPKESKCACGCTSFRSIDKVDDMRAQIARADDEAAEAAKQQGETDQASAASVDWAKLTDGLDKLVGDGNKAELLIRAGAAFSALDPEDQKTALADMQAEGFDEFKVAGAVRLKNLIRGCQSLAEGGE